MTFDEIKKSIEQLQNESFWKGFDACLEMVLYILDNALLAEQKEFIKDEILEEAELYKKDN